MRSSNSLLALYWCDQQIFGAGYWETSVKLKICHQNVVSFQKYWTWQKNEPQYIFGGTLLMRPANFRRWLLKRQVWNKRLSSECCVISKILNLTKEWAAVYLWWHFTEASSKFSALVTEETSVKLKICHQNVVPFQKYWTWLRNEKQYIFGGTLLMRPANLWAGYGREQC